jgi:hypothetical protein
MSNQLPLTPREHRFLAEFTVLREKYRELYSETIRLRTLFPDVMYDDLDTRPAWLDVMCDTYSGLTAMERLCKAICNRLHTLTAQEAFDLAKDLVKWQDQLPRS